ncbi:ISL3 family transposase [Streptomyces sp. NPDC050085]|uniref:ISL3 family transposase n=1 Tax=Streptomyces sp. NPDC050085 TaxID=3365600 RepID=UPI0037A045CC
MAPAARCPGCGTSARRVHSRYVRKPADTAVGGQPAVIDLQVRRFFCDNSDCGKKTFAEQVEGLTWRYGRRTVLLQRALEQVALIVGGSAGERLAAKLSMPVSGSTLLRLIRRLELPAVPAVEVLGVDEFAFRRGRKFGTILVDMHSRRPVDVLPDHTADTFAAWLQGRDHVRAVCRDRGGSFTEGAQRALPGVPQVADRWHVLHNLATAVEKTIRHHRPCIQPPEPPPAPDPGPEHEPPVITRSEENARARWQQIHPLYAKGMKIDTISQITRYDRTTVRRYAKATSPEELIRPRPRRRTNLDMHKPYLLARWTEGWDNAQILRDEIAACGYTGSRKTVRRFLNSLGNRAKPPTISTPPPSVADVVRWIIGRPENQSETARQQLKDLCDRCQYIAATNRLARSFATILRRRDGHRLVDWLEEVEQSELKELHVFANGVRNDLSAVTAGLTVP